MLFYLKYDPKMYQLAGSDQEFENIQFGKASWDSEDGIHLENDDLSSLVKGKTLFILTQNDLTSQKKLAEEKGYDLLIKDSIDGIYLEDVFYAIEVK